MILHHVAQGTCGFVITSATFHAQRFCRRDLHVIDVVRVPERREDCVGKAKNKDVLRRFLPQKMIDSVRLLFGKRIADSAIELAS